jgi:hypothetical protein
MDYVACYERLIDRARNRVLIGYSERHHVKPRCMGGDNSPENKVRLTPEEHFVAHKLLVKMNPGNFKLVWAAVAMTNATKNNPRPNNRLYGWLRRELARRLSKAHKGRKVSDETRAKQSAARKGRKFGPRSAEVRAKIAVGNKGKPKSKAHCEALAAAKLGKKRGPHSAEWKANQLAGILRAAAEGKFSYERSEEYKRLQSEKMKLVWEKRAAGELPMPANTMLPEQN